MEGAKAVEKCSLRGARIIDFFLYSLAFLLLQQAYHAIAVSRQMKLLALNSSNRSTREANNENKPKPEEVISQLMSYSIDSVLFIANLSKTTSLLTKERVLRTLFAKRRFKLQ